MIVHCLRVGVPVFIKGNFVLFTLESTCRLHIFLNYFWLHNNEVSCLKDVASKLESKEVELQGTLSDSENLNHELDKL